MIGRVLGHYRIVEKIGEGGMGVVYRAHDERLDRDVAVKVLPEDVAQSADRSSRFEREAKAVAKLDHPNILAIHDYGTQDGVTYAAMELLEGQSLRELISGGGITTGMAVGYAQTIADGLAAAHDKGIVHRDLKPENVFLTRDGRIKILDFGLAKLTGPEVALTTETPTETLDTKPGGLMGTVAYMAPEQLQGKRADHRSDIFALGVLLYEMLTGQRPFPGGTTAEVAAGILEKDPEQIPDSVPATLATVVSKCLAKRSEDRFSSAHDLSLTLGAIDTGVVTLPPREKSFVERRWPYIAAVVIVAIVALVFVLRPERLFERSADEPIKAEIPRIVVLPFENLGSPDDEYFADGITEELISRLAAVSGLQVISRKSAMYYKDKDLPLKQIGKELDVGYVLEGTIRWDRGEGEHGRVRITPQLIHVADDAHLWADRYDRVLEDIFAVQSDIAQQVVGQLQVALLGSERSVLVEQPTDNPEAYEAYLRGLANFELNDYQQILVAAKMFERAVELDPGFAQAWSRLSHVHSYLYGNGFDPTPARRNRAREAAERALSLDPEMPDGLLALGWYFYKCERDYEKALQRCAEVLKVQPNHEGALSLQAYVLRRKGWWVESTQLLEQVFRFSPRARGIASDLSTNYFCLRDFGKSEQYRDQAISLEPDNADDYLEKFEFLLRQGKIPEARAFYEGLPLSSPYLVISRVSLEIADRNFEKALETVRGIPENDWVDAFGTYGTFLNSVQECDCLYYLGDEEVVREICNPVRLSLEATIEEQGAHRIPCWMLGAVNAYLGRREDATREGEKAAALIKGDAMLHPRYLQYLAHIYTVVGEHEAALDQIEHLLSIPSALNVGDLRVHPYWDPLRDHPRFQALLEKYDNN
jgi:serine/threonine protein kinase/Tfp pilus assembly protein PilF